MDILKIAIIITPALIFINYGPDRGEIIFIIDFSLGKQGAILSQIKDKRKHLPRYESGLWNDTERNYDIIKREYRGVFKAFKKVRSWFYGVHFVLEIDAHVFLHQLNRFGTDLFGTLITRWLAQIRLFDFDVRHIPGIKHIAADGFFRRPRTQSDNDDEKYEVDIDNFIDAKFFSISVCPISARRAPELDDTYSFRF